MKKFLFILCLLSGKVFMTSDSESGLQSDSEQNKKFFLFLEYACMKVDHQKKDYIKVLIGNLAFKKTICLLCENASKDEKNKPIEKYLSEKYFGEKDWKEVEKSIQSEKVAEKFEKIPGGVPADMDIVTLLPIYQLEEQMNVLRDVEADKNEEAVQFIKSQFNLK